MELIKFDVMKVIAPVQLRAGALSACEIGCVQSEKHLKSALE